MMAKSEKNTGKAQAQWETHPWEKHGRLRISENGHYIEHEDETGFFWLGDTGWLIARLTPEDIDRYMQDRAKKGFNVIQMVPSLWGEMPNYAGEIAFQGEGTPFPEVKFNEKFWQHIDYIVNMARECGIYVAMVPLWGRNADNWPDESIWNSGIHGQFFADPDKHNYEFGKALGSRYKNEPHILWIVSGEYQTPYYSKSTLEPVPQIHIDRLKQVARGIRSGDTGNHLMTIHPLVFCSSSEDFHNEDWLDFNMIQSHTRPDYIPQLFSGDWNRSPAKPTVNGEAGYDGYAGEEEIHIQFNSAWIQRYQAYWSVFFGSVGFTYGHWNLFSAAQDYSPTLKLLEEWRNGPGILKQSALDAPAATCLGHLRALMESKPIQTRVPDWSLISINTQGSASSFITYDYSLALRCATRSEDGKWAMVYSTRGDMVRVVMSRLADGKASAFWYNPRNGLWYLNDEDHEDKRPFEIGVPSGSGSPDRYFLSPGEPADGNDWVLLLEVSPPEL